MNETKTEYRVQLGEQWVQTWHGKTLGGMFGSVIGRAKIFTTEANALEVAECLDGIVSVHSTPYQERDRAADDDHVPAYVPADADPPDALTPPPAAPNATQHNATDGEREI